jgi:hypothetical protein
VARHISLIPVVALVVACGGQTPSGTPAAEATASPATAAATAQPTSKPSPTPGYRWSLPTLGGDWTNRVSLTRVTVLVHEDGTNLTIATELSGAGGAPLEPGAAAFVVYLESVEGLETSATKDVEVGGIAATQLDVRATVDISELFHVGPADGSSGYALAKGQPARIWALDSGDATVVIVVEPPAGKPLAPSLVTAQPVIDSIVWE